MSPELNRAGKLMYLQGADRAQDAVVIDFNSLGKLHERSPDTVAYRRVRDKADKRK